MQGNASWRCEKNKVIKALLVFLSEKIMSKEFCQKKTCAPGYDAASHTKNIIFYPDLPVHLSLECYSTHTHPPSHLLAGCSVAGSGRWEVNSAASHTTTQRGHSPTAKASPGHPCTAGHHHCPKTLVVTQIFGASSTVEPTRRRVSMPLLLSLFADHLGRRKNDELVMGSAAAKRFTSYSKFMESPYLTNRLLCSKKQKPGYGHSYIVQ